MPRRAPAANAALVAFFFNLRFRRPPPGIPLGPDVPGDHLQGYVTGKHVLNGLWTSSKGLTSALSTEKVHLVLAVGEIGQAIRELDQPAVMRWDRV